LLSIAAVNDQNGQISNYTGMIFDLSQHKTVEALLNQLRTFDPLTALPNRESWLSELDQAVVKSSNVITAVFPCWRLILIASN
jgi:predicted signal transduction protein with EAL and GGDEF domain